MKKVVVSLFIVSMLFGSSSALAYTSRDLPDVTQGQSIHLEDYEPIVITQQEIHDNLKILNADKQKYLFEIASFTDSKSRDIALDKLRITTYLINEWKTHLDSNSKDKLFAEFTEVFNETVKVSKELPNHPEFQSKYDDLVKRLNEIKSMHDLVIN